MKFIFIFLIFLVTFASNSWAPIDFSKQSINDFLKEGFEVKDISKNVKEGFIFYTLVKKSIFGQNQLILCKVSIWDHGKAKCERP